MPISTRGQLDLSTSEQIDGFQDCEAQVHAGSPGDAIAPEIAADPGNSYRSVTRLKVTSTSDQDYSRIAYEFAADQSEVWLEFEIRFTHPVSSPTGTLGLLALTNQGGSSKLVELFVGSATHWKATNGSDGTFSTTIAKNSWEKIRLRYKAASGGNNGVLQAWRYNTGTGNYDSQLNITNNAATDAVRRIVLNCQATGNIASTSGDKIVWFRGFTWGTDQSHVGFKHRGLQFGHVCSPGSSSTINAQLFYRFPRAYHGTNIGAGGDPSNLAIQFQYMHPVDISWTNSGSPIAFEADGQDEYIVVHAVTGLNPLDAYDFRAIVASSPDSFGITTERISCTTPSAAGGDPGNLKFAFGSCCESAPSFGNPSQHPHAVMSMIRDEGVHGLMHLGDMIYADREVGYADDEPTIRAAYRKNFLWDFDQNRLHESAGFFPMWDDHELGWDNAYRYGPDPATTYGVANPAATAYWVDRRVNAIAGGKGWCFDTAKCRFIMMDMRTEKDLGDPEAEPPRPASMLGEDQKNAVKAKLADTGKPINFLFSPGPVVIGHGTSAAADGWNQPAFTGQRDELLAHFDDNNPSGSILVICSGDRHFVYVASDWEEDYGERVKPEWCSSPFAFNQRVPADLDGGGSSQHFVESDLGSPRPPIKRYCLIEIDESELSVTMSLIDGATGELVNNDPDATETYVATEA